MKAWAPTPKDDKPPPAPKDPKAEALDKELSEFQKNVTLGNWPVVKTYIASLPDEEAAAAYRQLLKSLQQRPGMAGRPAGPGGPDEMEAQMMMGAPTGPAGQQYAEKNAFSADDLLGLAAAAPAGTNPTAFPARAALAALPQSSLALRPGSTRTT